MATFHKNSKELPTNCPSLKPQLNKKLSYKPLEGQIPWLKDSQGNMKQVSNKVYRSEKTIGETYSKVVEKPKTIVQEPKKVEPSPEKKIITPLVIPEKRVENTKKIIVSRQRDSMNTSPEKTLTSSPKVVLLSKPVLETALSEIAQVKSSPNTAPNSRPNSRPTSPTEEVMRDMKTYLHGVQSVTESPSFVKSQANRKSSGSKDITGSPKQSFIDSQPKKKGFFEIFKDKKKSHPENELITDEKTGSFTKDKLNNSQANLTDQKTKDKVAMLAKRKTGDKNKLPDRSYTGYQVNFMSVFTCKDMRSGFEEHLKKESNYEPFEFLLELEEFPQGISSEYISAFGAIVEKYILESGESCLNLSGGVRRRVIESWVRNKDSWEDTSTPLDLLEPARSGIFNDLKMDSFWRFIYSDKGYECVMKNFDNPDVITQSALHAVMYKIQASFHGSKFSNDDQLMDFASNLVDKGKLKQTYLSTNWADTQKFAHRIRSSFLNKTNLKEENILGVSDKQFQQNIKIKILIIDRRHKQKPKRSGFINFLSPIITAIGAGDENDDDVEMYQTALMIGPYLFEWDENELIIPKKAISNAALISADVEGVHTLKTLDDKLDIIAETIVEWNATKGFMKTSTNSSKFGNSQDFVEDLLDAMDIKIQLPEPLAKFLQKIREKGTSKLEFCPNEKFQKKFDLKEPVVTFTTHCQLDEFVTKLFMVDSSFDWNYRAEYSFLKSIDRAFWMRHLHTKQVLGRTITERKMEKSDKVRDKMDREIKRLEEENDTNKPQTKVTNRGRVENCPFKDPLKTNSIML